MTNELSSLDVASNCTVGTSPFEILLEFKGSKRKLTLKRSDSLLCTVEQEMGRLGHDILLAPIEKSDQTWGNSSKQVFILQKWSDKFQTFVDVTDPLDFHDGDCFNLAPDPQNSQQSFPGPSGTTSGKVNINVCTLIG